MNNSTYMNVKMVNEYLHISSRTIFDRNKVDQWIANGCRKIEDLPDLPIPDDTKLNLVASGTFFKELSMGNGRI